MSRTAVRNACVGIAVLCAMVATFATTMVFEVRDAAANGVCHATCYVDAVNGNDANLGLAPGAGNALQTIGQALSYVDPAGTIIVAAGTYAENASIGTDGVTLLGPNAGLDPRPGEDTRVAEAIITNGSGTCVSVNADGVTFDGFTIGSCTQGGVFGIDVADLTVRNNIIEDAGSFGIAIECIDDCLATNNVVQDASAGVAVLGLHARVNDNLVRRSTGAAFLFGGGITVYLCVECEVSGNDIVDNNFAGLLVLAAFDTDNFTHTTISGNEIRGTMSEGGLNEGGGCAVILIESLLVDFEGNSIHDNPTGCPAAVLLLQAALITLTGNTVNGDDTQGPGLAMLSVTVVGVVLEENNFEGGVVHGSDDFLGILSMASLRSQISSAASQTASAMGLEGISTSGSLERSVLKQAMAELQGDPPEEPEADLIVRHNHFGGSSGLGLYVDSDAYFAPPQIATENWWGDASGPSYNGGGPGSGKAIVDPDGVVQFDPWLCSGADTDEDTPGFQPNTDNLSPCAGDNTPPVVTLTFVKYTTSGNKPYVPGTWSKWQVAMFITCTDPGADATGIKANTYPAQSNFPNDGIYDVGALLAGKKCTDNAGNVAGIPTPNPSGLFIKVDRHAPTCDVQPLVQYIPKNSPPDSAAKYTRSVTVSSQDGNLTGMETVTFESVTTNGIGSWTQTGPFKFKFEGKPGAIYTVRYRVTDQAGWTSTCAAKVKTSS